MWRRNCRKGCIVWIWNQALALSLTLTLSHPCILHPALFLPHIHVHKLHVQDLIANPRKLRQNHVVLKMYGHFLPKLMENVHVYFASKSFFVCFLFVFCLFFDSFICQFMYYRHIHESKPTHTISTFSHTTGTLNLWKHLYNDHLEQWVTSCDNLKIEIIAKAAIPFVKSFRQEPADTPLESEHLKYSKEAFVEAILEFIVGDDQVCAYFPISGKINVSPGYQCCRVTKTKKDICASSWRAERVRYS